jgi:hypothetical protein
MPSFDISAETLDCQTRESWECLWEIWFMSRRKASNSSRNSQESRSWQGRTSIQQITRRAAAWCHMDRPSLPIRRALIPGLLGEFQS